MATMAELAAAGADWLDEHEPGWVERIHLGRLELGDCELCVLGQLRGGFESAVEDSFGGDWGELEPYGFCLPQERDESTSYEALTDAWRDLILARRAGA